LVGPALADYHWPHHATNKQASKRDKLWAKIAGVTGLYRYRPSGTFFANFRKSGKLYTESLHTKDRATAKRLLRDFKARLDRTDPKFGKISFVDWLEQHYRPTLKGAESTLAGKDRIIERVKATWVAARSQPMAELRPSETERWLTKEFGDWTSGYYNSGLMLIRDGFAMAVRDHALMENPAGALKYRKRTKPIRLTPTWEEFKAIVQDVRSQKFSADARDSADFLEACGVLGLGQAELAGMKREHIDLESGRIIVYRFKTDTGFVIPIYPQACALIERLCEGKRHHQHIFAIDQARKALRHACKRLSFPMFSHRSLRRMFITRAIERGIDVKVIAEWQNHKDGGKLILDTYSHVQPAHSQRMAALMTDEEPENVIPLSEAGEQESKSG
jgi:integrase